MSRRFEAATLVGSPHYPNAVAWSEENLVAVASGHVVTILRPATRFGPRGLITLGPSKPFPIGVIDRQDLLSPCLLPTCLSREVKPCVRSISWSPIGFAPNAGCLLAVCTTEGRVKLYRMPYCEFASEWIEVMDISEMLFSYLVSVNFFDEPKLLSSGIADNPTFETQVDQSSAEIQPTFVSRQEKRPRRQKALTAVEIEPQKLNKDKGHGSGKKHAKQTPDCNLPLITAEQFASRNKLLSSLIVAWSPILLLRTGIEETSANNPPSNCSLLAVAGKSGRISFWRFDQPPCYTNLNSRQPISGSLIGLLEAHNFWITALSWELFVPNDASDPLLLLASGSSNGSVKIWKAYASEVMKSSETNFLSFCLLKEVVTADCGIVSVLSIFLPLESPGKVLLAIGQGSGLLEVWIGDLNSNKFDRESCFSAHDHILTGLAWAFGGNCLYSCSQDGSVRSWILHESILSEVPLPTNIPGVRSPSDVPSVYDLCFGLAISPGNLAMAMAHSFDSGLLNPMYEARIQKAAVEFLWIGGQQLDLTLSMDLEFEDEAIPDFSNRDLINWEHNILWSFKQAEHSNKPLVIWDIVAALLAFREYNPNYVAGIILQWIRYLFGSKFEVLPAISFEISEILSNITSRQLQILNVIGRRVCIKKLNVDQTISKEQGFKGLDGAEEEQSFWLKLVSDSERELRERLFALNCSAILTSNSFFSTEYVNGRSWTPVGLGQMMQWVSLNLDDLKEHVKSLAEEVGKIRKSIELQSICEYIEEERCSFCSAAVPFEPAEVHSKREKEESAEVAFCQGVKNVSGDGQRHKLARCAVSMLVCPIIPTWFCICCHRNALHLAPPHLFILPKYPLDLSDVSESCTSKESAKPLCPFCGILLQRRQPEFLLSPSPV